MKISHRIVITGLLTCLSCTALACGKERWSVKVGKDKDVEKVSTTIKTSNIAELTSIDAPTNPNIRRDTRYAPTETTTYQIKGKLIVIKSEADQDYHLVIEDNKGRTMILEAPDTSCAKGSRFQQAITDVRHELDAKYHLHGRQKKRLNEEVTVTGIAFFDKIHGQEGVAPNGIELHPILNIVFKP